MPSVNIEYFIGAARQHGEESEPDHEVGDLQTYLREMWELLTPQQREQFKYDERVMETLGAAESGERVRP